MIGELPRDGELADGLLAHGVAETGNVQILVGAKTLVLELLGAVEGRFIEGFVELTTAVIDQRGIGESNARQQRGAGNTGRQSGKVPFEVGHECLPVRARKRRLPRDRPSRVGG